MRVAGTCSSAPCRAATPSACPDRSAIEGERCIIGFCQPTTPCRISRDCPSAQVCIDGFCRLPTECLEDTDRDSGHVCDSRAQCAAP